MGTSPSESEAGDVRYPFLKQVRKVGTSPSVLVCLDALREAFKASARPGRTQAPDTGLRLRPVGPFAKRESDSARELKARRTGGGQCRWSQRVAPFGNAWTEVYLGGATAQRPRTQKTQHTGHRERACCTTKHGHCVYSLSRSVTHSLTLSLSHSLTLSLSHSLTHSLTLSLTLSLSQSLTLSLSHCLTLSLSHSLSLSSVVLTRSVHTQDSTTRNSHVCAVQLSPLSGRVVQVGTCLCSVAPPSRWSATSLP